MDSSWRYFGILLVLLACGLLVGARAADEPNPATQSSPSAGQSVAELLPSRLPPGRRAIVAVLALNEGTETTDFLVPHALLKRSGVADVEAVALRRGPVELMPALRIAIEQDLQDFDRRYPAGADIVIVPALHDDAEPQVLAWLRQQAARGALMVGICSGTRVLGQAGLLEGRSFTGHWFDRDSLLRRHRGAMHMPDRRFWRDGPVLSTTGVSASLTVSIALVEALGGRERAAPLAAELGLADWSERHNSAPFGLRQSPLLTVAANWLMRWRHESLQLPVEPGSDDVTVALIADAWSRSYRSEVQAVALNGAPQALRLRSGIQLLAAQPQGGQNDGRWLRWHDGKPVAQLREQLCMIEARYGAATRRWVAMQMEDESGLNLDCAYQHVATLQAR
ncbi:DJ-1/PfpI family protein [Paucibacter sp. APW11]|uniref:DJ-1/PfpI family protein n=1 Tax=Roseateles aquae TaxID=3077235 RepID=A0ABU3P743_9BURK|nr:DJ-1/PfpI family protein [Paucibacter sp. APW11]MDT8998412.1 DJ-1/PfpI family protein [Paucibacter sp. APW11]